MILCVFGPYFFYFEKQRLFDFLDLEGGITPGSYKLVHSTFSVAFS